MTISALGINHKTAPVDLREQVAFNAEQLDAALQAVRGLQGVQEAVIVSTCNRTELYCRGDVSDDLLLGWFTGFHSLPPDALQNHHYLFKNDQAISHLMSVASGLDSLVLGEPQILGQVKQAYQIAKRQEAVGGILERLFQQTFRVAKTVRNETAVGQNAVSVAYAAVSMARHIFSNLAKSKVLLIGAGDTSELVAQHLKQQGVTEITVANRTLQRARELAEKVDGAAHSLSELSELLPDADIVVSSTASTLPIVGKGTVEKALKKRRHKPMLLIDLAVPRDIEEQVNELDDAYLYTVDDLQSIISENIRNREQAAKEAQVIIRQQAQEFTDWLQSLNSVELVRSYRQHTKAVADTHLERALAQLQQGKAPEEVLKQFSHKLVQQLTHQPTSLLKSAGENNDQYTLAVLQQLWSGDGSDPLEGK
ncbi:glutamyl-tRNA reductase [Idiomarina sp. WRN-38]|jgi:glutamyl-tRNA reductase|uniref:glutamyl-tRNA reductase n=1 Tax=Idiomarina sp. OXR-189 TaxID=3100175 RepID=UPI00073375A5|nr:glutamyl-tRNA reductase [Idiomarina sp. OXR-189]KTG24000.1 glutamyl-tRNA reductase [Idiomarina sp. H105]OAE91391.1 glutamyl-tRNA reductase [Idiomarina sp. WRN-38]WPZ02279.1 glutamyl-tRNA reductase [Idiomarina sp. OXR-189]